MSVAGHTGYREKQRDSGMWGCVWWGGSVRGYATLVSQRRDAPKSTPRYLLVPSEIRGSTRQHAELRE